MRQKILPSQDLDLSGANRLLEIDKLWSGERMRWIKRESAKLDRFNRSPPWHERRPNTAGPRCRRALTLALAAIASVTRATAQSQPTPQSPQPAVDTTELINPDRPGIADGSRVIKQGQAQIEFGLQEEHRRENVSTRTTTVFIPTLLRFGLTQRLELRVESNSVTSTRTTTDGAPVERRTGYSPVSLGFKCQISDSHGDGRRSFGMIVRVFPPSGSTDFRNDKYTGDARLAADWDFAPKLSLNPNVGAARQEDSRGRAFVAALGALTLNYLPTEKLNPFVDAGFQSPEETGGASALTLDTGVAYIIGRDLQVDLSVGRGVRGLTPPRPFVAIGMSLRPHAHGRPSASQD
jgi:Putative MetA-pathway of phenol degradation